MIDRWRMHLLLLVCSVFRLNCYIRFCILITDQILFCVLTRFCLVNRKKGGNNNGTSSRTLSTPKEICPQATAIALTGECVFYPVPAPL